MRHLANFVGLFVGSSLLWSIGCTTTPKLPQNKQQSRATSSSCLVTLPNGTHNSRETPSCSGNMLPSPVSSDNGFRGNHGDGKLWVGLPTESRLLVTPDKDGSLGWKFPWWRAVCGRLTITGRRLDAPASPLRSEVPSGYGEAGFQASGVYFPSEGCWEITGRAGDAELTFVVEVRIKR